MSKIDLDGVLAGIGVSIFVACMAIPVSVVIGAVVYTVIDNLDVHFIEKCVKAGATEKACYDVVNPKRIVK